MSDERRRELARAAGDGDLDAARDLVHTLEREGQKPRDRRRERYELLHGARR